MSSRTALVTGCAGPMGQAFAERLMENGHKVIAVDLNEEKLNEFAAKFPEKCFAFKVDVSNEQDVIELAAKVKSEPGSPDILVNNAGILTNNKIASTSYAEWQKVMGVNLSGPFLLCKYLLPSMLEKGWGRIINISSLAAKSGGITAGTAYSTSKGGVMSLTYSLAMETAGTGVTVNGIAPAYVKTPMVTEQLTEAERAAIIEKIPVKRFCEPSEVAALVAFLAGEEAGFITGEIVDQNGGLLFD